MVRHIVMWKLLVTAEGRDKAGNGRFIKSLLEGLVPVIPEIRQLEVGINGLANDSNFDVVLNCVFDDLAALGRYQDHPEHLKAAALIAPLRSARSAVDYEF